MTQQKMIALTSTNCLAVAPGISLSPIPSLKTDISYPNSAPAREVPEIQTCAYNSPINIHISIQLLYPILPQNNSAGWMDGRMENYHISYTNIY